MIKTVLLLLTVLLSLQSRAQTLYMPRNVRAAFESGARSMNGKPGPNYWENRSNYTIDLTMAPPNQALDMATKLYELKHPVRFLFLEGGSHGLFEYRDLMWESIRRFFDRYVKNEAPLPDMNPHGN